VSGASGSFASGVGWLGLGVGSRWWFWGIGGDRGEGVWVRDLSNPRLQRWRDAVQTLVDLQVEYQSWLDNLPDSLEGSAAAEKLETVCEYDFGGLEALEPPLGFGRD